MSLFNRRNDPPANDAGPDYNPDWHCTGCGCSGYDSDPPCTCNCPCNPNGW